MRCRETLSCQGKSPNYSYIGYKTSIYGLLLEIFRARRHDQEDDNNSEASSHSITDGRPHSDNSDGDDSDDGDSGDVGSTEAERMTRELAGARARAEAARERAAQIAQEFGDAQVHAEEAEALVRTLTDRRLQLIG